MCNNKSDKDQRSRRAKTISKTFVPPPCTHPPCHTLTHAPTHAQPSLPVDQDPSLTPPNLYPSALHDTAAIYLEI